MYNKLRLKRGHRQKYKAKNNKVKDLRLEIVNKNNLVFTFTKCFDGLNVVVGQLGSHVSVHVVGHMVG